MPHKIEYARIFPLMLAEGLVIHKKVNNVTVAVNRVNPLGKFVGGKRPFGPSAI